ncbi:hypothetical protein GcM3_153012 [Golovinomyces cichoracearum]|uniref:Uncharacterized protein n=1 Tax=Golovinomyces cichoracearum TaxID=62708 RepID=A0A420HWB7_9PEZI|nr:hypothetical protein GcM3_153012 [Golovinomyces cichoracearum]
MAGSSSAYLKRYILTNDDSWTNWYGQIKEQATSYQLESILKPFNPESTPLENPGIPEYPDIVREVDYLTIITSANSIDPTSPSSEPPEPFYELTIYNRARFNDKAKNAAERDMVREKRVNFSKLRNFIFETIDDSNKAHLQSCINNLDSVSIGNLSSCSKDIGSRVNLL